MRAYWLTSVTVFVCISNFAQAVTVFYLPGTWWRLHYCVIPNIISKHLCNTYVRRTFIVIYQLPVYCDSLFTNFWNCACAYYQFRSGSFSLLTAWNLMTTTLLCYSRYNFKSYVRANGSGKLAFYSHDEIREPCSYLTDSECVFDVFVQNILLPLTQNLNDKTFK